MNLGDTIAVDFDGVLHAYTSGWTGPEPLDGPVPGAVQFIQRLLAAGYDVEVFSARIADEPDAVGHIERWLARHGFPPLTVSCTKGAHYIAFIDDRAVPFRGDFDETFASLDALLAAPKWWLDSA